ncbi:MAG: late competence development ComFB family protein [Desulfovibrio sp.]|jgi:hypothetical protein|nr:late competence development ComFB family protein [Desulfovibrio sp.]
MPKTREKYIVEGVDLYYIRNRNEKRVAQALRETITRKKLKKLTANMIKDAYAFSLNSLQARYTQRGTIVLRDPVRASEINAIVAEALNHIIKNPK